MSYPAAVLADSPLGYWRFEETSGTTAADSSGNGRDGTYVNGNAFGYDGPPCLPDWSYSPNTNLAQHVTVADDAAWDVTNAASWEALVLLDESVQYGNIIDRDQGPGGQRVFQFRVHNFSDIGLIIFIGGVAKSLATSGLGLNNKVWHHVVATYDGAKMRIYVDNVLTASQNQTGNIDAGTNGLWLGRMQANQQQFNGRMDEVAFYNTVLSTTRIDTHYKAGIDCGGWLVGAIGF